MTKRAHDDPEEIKASLLSHLREESVEYTMTGHGVAQEFAEMDAEFAAIEAAYMAAHKAVVTWAAQRGVQLR